MTLLFFALSSCSSTPAKDDKLPDLLATNEDEKLLRLKYGVYDGEPRTTSELIKQIFAADDIDPQDPLSRSLIAVALKPYELNFESKQKTGVVKPGQEEGEVLGRQQYEMALNRLLLSPSFSEIYYSQLKLLLEAPRSKIAFNNQSMNCGGAITGGVFGNELVGVVLYFDFSEETKILTTRGYTRALPERIIAHELLEALQATDCSRQINLSQGDDGLLGMDTVLQVNKIMRELVKVGALSPLEGASRIRYYR